MKLLIYSATAKKSWGTYYPGFDGFQRWINALRDFDESKENFREIVSVNDFQLLNLIDARRCAFVYIEEYADALDKSKAEKVKEIAEIYKDISRRLNAFHKPLRDITGSDRSENIRYNSSGLSLTLCVGERNEQKR